MRVFESPRTRSDINSASRAVRMSRQGTGWDAVEHRFQHELIFLREKICV